MSAFLSSFEFLRPMLLWLLPVVFLLYFFKQKNARVSSLWEKVCDTNLLKYLILPNKNFKQKWRSFFVFLFLLSAVIGAAGPSFRLKELPTLSKENPVMFVLSLSSDMNRTDIRPSRLARSKIEMKDILLSNKFDPTGLIVYTDEPFLISPLASDPNLIVNLLNAVQTNIMPAQGSRLDRAIDFALNRLIESGYFKGNIVVLSNALSAHSDEAFGAAEAALKKGFPVSVYHAGISNDAHLSELARKGGGMYLNADVSDNTAFIDFLAKASSNDLTPSQNKALTAQDNGWWFALVAGVCFLLFVRRSVFVFLFAFFFSTQAFAGFFFNADQEGALLFSSKEYAAAAQKFKNNDWRASAYYKAGDYASSAQIFGQKDDVTSLYNKGNALAKGGKIPQAIEQYEKVLKIDPSHEDAKFNLEYLKKMMQNEQQSKNNENKREENPQDQNNPDSQNGADDNQNSDDKSQSEDQSSENDNQNQNNEQQNEQQSSSDQSLKDPQDQSDGQNNAQNNLENDQSLEKEQIPQLSAKEQQADEYDETVQAREQQFREIKDDPGGLLKAFISQEYLKNRYERK